MERERRGEGEKERGYERGGWIEREGKEREREIEGWEGIRRGRERQKKGERGGKWKRAEGGSGNREREGELEREGEGKRGR